jgi:hypothetical protein
MIIYANITYRQTDKYINSIVRNLTKEMQINKLEIHDSYLATFFLVLNIFGLVSAPFVFQSNFNVFPNRISFSNRFSESNFNGVDVDGFGPLAKPV